MNKSVWVNLGGLDHTIQCQLVGVWKRSGRAYNSYTQMVTWIKRWREKTGAIRSQIGHREKLIMQTWRKYWSYSPYYHAPEGGHSNKQTFMWASVGCLGITTSGVIWYEARESVYFTCWYVQSSGWKSLLVCSNFRLKWGSLCRRFTHHGGE